MNSDSRAWPFPAPPPRSLAASPYFIPIRDAIVSALDAAHPARAVERALFRTERTLSIDQIQMNLDDVSRIRVIGGGKGAQSMAAALFGLLGAHLETGAVVIKQGEIASAHTTGPIEVMEGAHPIPDESSLTAARAMLDLSANLSPRDLVFVVISGGASALLTLPSPPLRLSDLQQTTDILIRAGIDIAAINTVRKHLSAIKGGNLARHIHPARFITLILSDVVGDPIDAIGSGPTVPDDTTYADSLRILEQAHLFHKLPARVRAHLQAGVNGARPDTPFSHHPAFSHGTSHIIGGNRTAAEAAAATFRQHGFETRLHTSLTGEARVVGRRLVQNTPRSDSPSVQVFGGETTVTVTGHGKGGRNQELALSAAHAMRERSNMLLITIATDGGDGPTDAAGAIATPTTLERGASRDLSLESHLENNNAYPFFDAIGDLLITGPTRTNVADLTFLVSW